MRKVLKLITFEFKINASIIMQSGYIKELLVADWWYWR